MQLPELYILRHGLSQANLDGLTAGTYETELTAEGIRQAKEAGAYLKNIPLKRLYSSPQQRTQMTSQALGLSLLVVYDERLREMNFGIFERQHYSMRNQEGYTFERLFGDHSLTIPQGECYSDVERRVTSFIQECLVEVKGPVAIVTHGATGRIMLATLLPQLKPQIRHLHLGNAEVIRVSNGGYQLVCTPK